MLTTSTKYPVVKTTLQNQDHNDYTLTITPLLPGFGSTIGNSLRRILLSSIPGFAVTKVRINDITHEYQAISHVTEDALDVLLNLKNIRARILTDDETVTLVLKTNEEGDIFAKDFSTNAAIEIINKDAYICHLEKGGKLHLEVEIGRGYGYVSYEQRDLRGNTDPTGILIDSAYSPVRNVLFTVEQTRVGDKTNFDKLIITFSTDGTVAGQEIAEFALKLTVDMYQNIFSSFQAGVEFAEVEKELTKLSASVPAKTPAKKSSSDEILLSPRIVKILEKNNIKTNKKLLTKKDEVMEMAGLGDKAIEEITKYIKKLNKK
jgi:DNA-directed RNA polymerase subunit alpha